MPSWRRADHSLIKRKLLSDWRGESPLALPLTKAAASLVQVYFNPLQEWVNIQPELTAGGAVQITPRRESRRSSQSAKAAGSFRREADEESFHLFLRL
jgi:hypothetical protein